MVVQRRTSSACRTAPLGPALLCCRERLAICLKSVQHRKGVSDKPESCQLAVQARLSSPQAPRACDNRALISTYNNTQTRSCLGALLSQYIHLVGQLLVATGGMEATDE